MESKNRIGLLGGLISLTFAIAAANAGDVLLYTDNSPGAVHLAFALREASLEAGCSTTTCITLVDFAARINQAAWARIIVVAAYPAEPPGYLADLRCVAEGGALVELYYWRPRSDDPVTGNEQVWATTLAAIWQAGQTTSVIMFESRETNRTDPLVHPGYVVPEMSETVLAHAETVSPWEMPELVGGTASNPTATPRNVPGGSGECVQTLLDALQGAGAQFPDDTGKCNEAFGPHPNDIPPRPGDPIQLVDCLAGAAGDYANLIKAALRRYKVCLAIATPTSQPAQ
ncbi:MAG: hypothetical protein HRU71_00755 [Planctomycetia bacterium]|nr:MAG: hypothetical protein HRU71_00755 [Planctomycetia bacterium]